MPPRLPSRSRDRLLLSLKVIAALPAGTAFGWHAEHKGKPVVFAQGGPDPFLAVICLPPDIIRQTRLVFSLVLTTAN